MMFVCELNSCTGCGACYNVCPHNAINMVEDSEGFLYPQIDPSLCKNCGLCQKICPVNNPNYNNNENPECYAAAANDELRKDSSSGALFPAIAEYILNKDGYICGVAYDENLLLEHIIVDNKKDLNKLKSSKYFQSNTKNCYKEIEKLLKDCKLVLFSGTPCQVAGLYAYLKKDYDNLLTIDLVCHGVPSPMVYKKYISELQLDSDEKVLNTNFRDKVNGWSSYLTTTITTKRILSKPAREDVFMQAFLSDVCLRKSCHECRFAKIPRQADITLGDFWGINRYNRRLNDGKGTSLVLTNSEKGENIINEIKKELKIFKKAPLKIAKKGNPRIYESNKKNTVNRTMFFSLIKEKTLKETVEICANDKCDYLLINFFWSGNNYGAVLTAYALQQFIDEFGFKSKFLNTGEHKRYENYETSTFGDFAHEFLNISKSYKFKQAKKLSQKVKGVILGSDQVLRPDALTGSALNKYLLNFVDNNTKKIALSASFGLDLDEFKQDKARKSVQQEMDKAYKSFDYLSCREVSGVDIFKDVFGLNADFILDPVFLVDKSAYDRILNLSDVAFDGIVSYVLDKNSKYDEVYNYLCEKLNTSIVKMDAKKGDISVSNWLKYIKDCKLLITDSFHGVCFALIFNKPFICLKNKKRGQTRFDSFIETFEIKDNFVSSLDEIYSLDLDNNINYGEFNRKLDEEVSRCKVILKEVLCNNYSNNENAVNYKNKNQRIGFNYLYLKHSLKFLLYSFLYLVASKKKKAKAKAKMFKYKSIVSWF
ncbi:Coenzyme F420 hydrogenase/dehydrogenase, beta subunit C-terminal domain [bacterium]|nr:Coenzyme F420 hydrogenase/dehydrogenase, beta subunit C-terminal domain [bacterium]